MQERVFDDSVVFAGGRLCLDFVNTACERRGDPLEFIGDEAALNQWLAVAAGIYGGQAWVAEGAKSLDRAHTFRAALTRIVHAVRLGEPPVKTDLNALNAILKKHPRVWQLEHDLEGFHVALAAGGGDAWLGEIARDAADLLAHGDLTLLRQCECETCVRVFYDTTKNHRRRWCVEKCGSRVKAANYYRRKRERSSAESPL